MPTVATLTITVILIKGWVDDKLLGIYRIPQISLCRAVGQVPQAKHFTFIVVSVMVSVIFNKSIPDFQELFHFRICGHGAP